jgi:cell wall-associated NlpC family hydrolase
MTKKHLLLFAIACIISSLLDACQSSHEFVAHKSSKQPKFIDNVYIAPHNKSNATANAITPQRAPEPKRTEITKPVNEPDAIETASASTAPETASLGKIIYPASYKAGRHRDEEDDDIKDIRKKYAGILGVRPKDLDNAALYKFIDRWYGTNYRLGGCDISGIDCSGFVQKLYSEVYGIDIVRTAIDQFGSCKRIKRYKNAKEGDLVFFRVHSRKKITHVGIYLANDYFVHASRSQGVIISNLNEEYWQRYFAGAGRIPKAD